MEDENLYQKCMYVQIMNNFDLNIGSYSLKIFLKVRHISLSQ